MAENFRNKQWFKNMPQERKDEICKKFDINENTLRKCGRETEDGRIVIDLLRIDHLLHCPKIWDECNNALKNGNNYSENLRTCQTLNEVVEVCENIYDIFSKNSYLKYKDTLHNNVLVKYTRKNIQNAYDTYLSCDTEDKPYRAYMLYTHLKVLLESDLNIIKDKSI